MSSKMSMKLRYGLQNFVDSSSMSLMYRLGLQLIFRKLWYRTHRDEPIDFFNWANGHPGCAKVTEQQPHEDCSVTDLNYRDCVRIFDQSKFDVKSGYTYSASYMSSYYWKYWEIQFRGDPEKFDEADSLFTWLGSSCRDRENIVCEQDPLPANPSIDHGKHFSYPLIHNNGSESCSLIISVDGADAVAKGIDGTYQMTDRTILNEPVWSNVQKGTYIYKIGGFLLSGITRQERWVIGKKLGLHEAIAQSYRTDNTSDKGVSSAREYLLNAFFRYVC